MARSVTFIHAADLHLGAPFHGLRSISPIWADRLAKAIPDAYRQLVETAISHQVDFVVLAGFLLKIPDEMLTVFPDKIVNIHPSLLPKYGGKGMYGMKVHEAVVAAGEKESGITIHTIDNHYDEGSVVFQTTVPVLPTDSPEDVAHKVHELEYKYFPQVIEDMISKL